MRKEQLLQELDAVQRDTLAVASAASRGQADPAGSPRDQANSMAADMVRDAEAARDHAELTAVRAALRAPGRWQLWRMHRLRPERRRAAPAGQPSAARCIACQSKAETQTRR